jgi:hypothetical protein
MICLLTSLVSVAGNLKAEVVSDKLLATLKIGLNSVQREGPDSRSNHLVDYRISWHQPLFSHFRTILALSYIPDIDNGSRSLNVNEEWLNFLPGIEWSYPMLFRWHLSAGPMFLTHKVRYSFKQDGVRQNHTIETGDYGFFVNAGIDYAFNEDYECSLIAGITRPSSQKNTDWYYGASFNVNMDFPWSRL